MALLVGETILAWSKLCIILKFYSISWVRTHMPLAGLTSPLSNLLVPNKVLKTLRHTLLRTVYYLFTCLMWWCEAPFKGTAYSGQSMNPILMLWAITKKQERPNVFTGLLNHIKYIHLIFEPYKIYLFYPLMSIKIHLVFWVLLCLPLCDLLRNIVS